MTTSVFRNSLNALFNDHNIKSDQVTRTIIDKHISVTKDVALQVLDGLDWKIKQEAHDDYIAYWTPQINKIGLSAKIYAVFYVSVVAVLTALTLTGYLSFTYYAPLICTASALNLFIQWATPLNNLKRLKDRYYDPCNELSELVKEAVSNGLQKISASISEETKYQFSLLVSWNNTAPAAQKALIKHASETCQNTIHSELFKGCEGTYQFPKEMRLDKPNIVGLPECASLIHTLAIALLVVLTFKGYIPSSLSPKIILGTVPLGIVSSLCLQRTLDNRIVNPFGARTLKKDDADKIKQRLIEKINLICL